MMRTRNGAHMRLSLHFGQTVDVFFKVRPGDLRGSGDGLTLHSRCENPPVALHVGERPAGNSGVFLILRSRERGSAGCMPDFAPAALRRDALRPQAPCLVLRSAGGAKQDGGARRDRTDDLMLAKHALYQLSYGPTTRRFGAPRGRPPLSSGGP